MIFGFNTDVRVDQTVYHVQSEVREAEHLLQTQVFVAGRCIGKRGLSIVGSMASHSAAEQEKHEMLREQHRWVLSRIRAGQVDEVFDPTIDGPQWRQNAAQAASTGSNQNYKPLRMEFVGSERPNAASVLLRFRVTQQGCAAGNVKLSAQLQESDPAGLPSSNDAASGVTTVDGIAQVCLPVPPGSNRDFSLLVTAENPEAPQNTVSSRRFRLRIAK